MLNKWETFFLLILTLPIIGHVVILPMMLDIAGRDAWISILLALPAGLLFAFAIFRLRSLYPTTNINDLMKLLLGKWFGKIVILLLILYFSFLTIVSFTMLVDLIYIVFLPQTPRLAILAWFWIFCIYAASKGIKRIALTAGILTFITLITGHSVSLMDAGKKDWNQLQPILEYGWSPIFLGSIVIISIWIELLLLLCIPIKNIHEKRFFLVWTVGIFLNALMMLSTTTGAIAIFGLGQAENFVYPATEIVRVINLGIIDRFDVYALILMTFGSYIRCSLYLRITYELSVTNATAKWVRYAVFFFYAILAFVVAAYLAADHFRVEGTIVVYSYMVFLFPISFVLWFISWIKRSRKTRGDNYPS